MAAVQNAEFNLISFLKFLEQNNIAGIAIAAILSERISEVVTEFVNTMVMPIINREYDDGDTSTDIKKLDERTMKFYGINLKVGKFIMCLIKFIIMVYLLFLVIIVVNKVVRML